jgi:sugar phosphate isomerase/epimerase
VEFITSAHFEDVGVCLDLGHAHMLGGVAPAFEILKDHIRSTHVHDNGGDKDAHLWPGDGSIDWQQAVRLLRTAPNVPPLLLEVEGGQQPDIVVRMGETFRKLEEAEEKATVE